MAIIREVTIPELQELSGHIMPEKYALPRLQSSIPALNCTRCASPFYENNDVTAE